MRILPGKISRHSKKTILIMAAILFVLLYISLVRAASIQKPNLKDDEPVHLEKLADLPDGVLQAQKEADNRENSPEHDIEHEKDALEVDNPAQNAEHNQVPGERENAGKHSEEEEEEEKGALEDEDGDGDEAGQQMDHPGIVNEQMVEENIEEGAGDEREPSGPKDDGNLKVPQHHDDIEIDGAHKEVKPLKIEDIQPPDHLDAVRMEQDGHLNRDYKKEIFLGNHEEMEQGTDEELENKLKDIFFKVDTDFDGRVSKQELEDWIILKVQDHFDEAAEENEKVFSSLDMNKDAFISWKEFHYQFLKAKGYKDDDIAEESESYDSIPLDPAEKETIIRYKFRWAEADEEPQDNKLTLEEFQNFRHPEQSQSMMDKMVDEILTNLDVRPNDGIISEDEFAALPPGEEYDHLDETDKSWQEERKREFREMIDVNHDGKVGKEELKNYVDPKNPSHSRLEAENLLEMADENDDGKLSLSEVLRNKELFFGSKVVDTGRSFHDEF